MCSWPSIGLLGPSVFSSVTGVCGESSLSPYCQSCFNACFENTNLPPNDPANREQLSTAWISCLHTCDFIHEKHAVSTRWKEKKLQTRARGSRTGTQSTGRQLSNIHLFAWFPVCAESRTRPHLTFHRFHKAPIHHLIVPHKPNLFPWPFPEANVRPFVS